MYPAAVNSDTDGLPSCQVYCSRCWGGEVKAQWRISNSSISLASQPTCGGPQLRHRQTGMRPAIKVISYICVWRAPVLSVREDLFHLLHVCRSAPLKAAVNHRWKESAASWRKKKKKNKKTAAVHRDVLLRVTDLWVIKGEKEAKDIGTLSVSARLAIWLH